MTPDAFTWTRDPVMEVMEAHTRVSWHPCQCVSESSSRRASDDLRKETCWLNADSGSSGGSLRCPEPGGAAAAPLEAPGPRGAPPAPRSLRNTLLT